MFRWGFALLVLSAATASAAETRLPPVATQQWRAYAGCAAGYQANWQDRLNDPHRTHDMSNMIHDQSEDYKKAAIGFYQSEQKASSEDANRIVADYLAANIGGFLAMDAAGTLEAYLDTCPQLEASDTK
jgi:hypothetical protein